MTELFKYLALFCAVSLAYGFTDVRDDVNWFKNGERITNKFVTGVVNGILDSDCNDAVDGEQTEGECMSKTECAKFGGKAGGLCSLMGFCCVIRKTCKETSSSKVSYFVPPSRIPSHCPLTLKKYSSNVCQIRLDFETFDIAQPTSEGSEAFKCSDAQFSVTDARKRLGFRHLCGKNNGQHIYIPVSKDESEITLSFNFVKKDGDDQPTWKIKITQLECWKSDNNDFLSAPTKLMAIHNNLKNKIPKTPKCNRDLIAPPGCLQYYINESGTFESFNYNKGNGPYIGELDYAICFRRTPEVCGLRFTPRTFQMNQNEDGKCHPEGKASETVSQDYIRITEGVEENKFKDHFCGNKLKKVVARSYEPLYVGVHTDKFIAQRGAPPSPTTTTTEPNVSETVERGFRIEYQLDTTDCGRDNQ